MHSISKMGLVALMLASAPAAKAQLYGASPFSNGPTHFEGALYEFDPDTLGWLAGRRIFLEGFTVTGVNGLTVHPNLAPPLDENNGKVYAVLKVTGVSGRVLATVDPATGVATTVGNLGDNFASISFREDGQLFGVTGDGATVPETLYLIDKTNATKTVAAALGAGGDGEAIAYNPVDDRFYHWSGNATVVLESVMSVAPYTTTNIPIIGSTDGEIFGAVWDPCQLRTIGPVTAPGFITTNINTTFNIWFPIGESGPALGNIHDNIRGLALIGGDTCDADLGIGIGSADPAPTAGDPITIDLVVANAGQARAMTPVVTITLPASVTSATTSGCNEDPAGIPTCTPKVFVQRIDANGDYFPFQISNLWRGRSVTVTISGIYNGEAGDVVASVASASNEPLPADNTATYRLGTLLFKDSFD